MFRCPICQQDTTYTQKDTVPSDMIAALNIGNILANVDYILERLWDAWSPQVLSPTRRSASREHRIKVFSSKSALISVKIRNR